MNKTIAILAFVAGGILADYTYPSRYWEEDEALCGTDTECMELCPEGSWNLPPDHPDYCDGGPKS